jgi:hypothetical protein
MDETCRSCGARVGQLHDPFCNRELCPFCGHFITTCDRIFEVLGLSDAERVVVEEYIDDSVDSLRGGPARDAVRVVGATSRTCRPRLCRMARSGSQ